jgi:peptide/nickel transport system permease protein
MATLPAPQAPGADVLPGAETGRVSRRWRAFLHNPLGVIGLVLLVFLVLFSFVGPLIYRVSPYQPDLSALLQPPSPQHPLGTDPLGRDALARLMQGGQLSLIVGFAAALVSMAFGTVYGITSGILGGFVDVVMMRIVDVIFALPGIFILLLLNSIFTPNAFVMVFVIASLAWVGVARLVRSEVLRLRELDYVEAARATGASTTRIIFRHLLPNVTSVVLVAGTFQVADAILTVAALSYLGLGLPPPAANWGGMLSDSLQYVFQNPWWLIYPPGICIVLAELGVNFVGDALRQAFDPRLQEGRA